MGADPVGACLTRVREGDEDAARRFGLKPFSREQRAQLLEGAISRIAAMQAPNGGYSLWGNASEYEYWLSAYVTSFLQDAQNRLG